MYSLGVYASNFMIIEFDHNGVDIWTFMIIEFDHQGNLTGM